MSTDMSHAGHILAAIILYRPDIAHIARMIAALRGDVGLIALYLNSVLDAKTRARLEEGAPGQILWLGSGANVGLGEAYNECLDEAVRRGATRLLLFDQDSMPPPGLATRLDHTLKSLQEAQRNPVAIGPFAIDADGAAIKGPVARGMAVAGAVEASFLISSGKMMDVDAARAVGAFRADFFIDAIDIEWCLRARFLGYSVWMDQGVKMDHQLGNGIITLPGGVMRITRQPSLRVYTYLRNQIAMLGMPHVPLGYKARFLLTLPIRLIVYLGADPSLPMRRALWRGLRDGITHRLGSPMDRL
jgi:rhamnosyltransferase